MKIKTKYNQPIQQTARINKGETHRAIKECAKWLVFCLDTGWPKNALDGLEKIWWIYHKPNGKLIKSKPTQKP